MLNNIKQIGNIKNVKEQESKCLIKSTKQKMTIQDKIVTGIVVFTSLFSVRYYNY